MKSITLTEGTDIIVPDILLEEARKVLRSLRQIGNHFPGEPHVFRFVDLGAEAGVFAAFAAMRWPYAWIDAYEPRGELAMALRLNAQPGTRFFNELPVTVPRCDGLHVGGGVKGLRFEGAWLAELNIVVVSFEDDESFEQWSGLCRHIGLRLAHAMVHDGGPPCRGTMVWIRPPGSAAPSFEFDLTSKQTKERLEKSPACVPGVTEGDAT